jgi:hypothetical protein
MNPPERTVEIDMAKARFNIKQTAEIVGVTELVLNQWCARGSIRLGGDEKPGRGVPRLFSREQVFFVRMAKIITGLGLGVTAAFAISSAVTDFFTAGAWSAETDTKNQLSRWLLIAPFDLWPAFWRGRVSRADDFGVVLRMHSMKNPNAVDGRDAALKAARRVIAIDVDSEFIETAGKIAAVIQAQGCVQVNQ